MSSASNSEKKMIVLKSYEGELFEVEELVAMESQTIKHLIEDNCADSRVPLPNVTSRTLAKVIEYCRRHVEVASKADAEGGLAADKLAYEELAKFDANFVNVDKATLFDLVLAANYLSIQGLLDLTCQNVAEMIKGKSPAQIRSTFNIVNDFTKEEEEEIRRENAWAFE